MTETVCSAVRHRLATEALSRSLARGGHLIATEYPVNVQALWPSFGAPLSEMELQAHACQRIIDDRREAEAEVDEMIADGNEIGLWMRLDGLMQQLFLNQVCQDFEGARFFENVLAKIHAHLYPPSVGE